MKKGKLNDESAKEIVNVMATLNRKASEALEGLNASALTDVTGFGLFGHLHEMLAGSGTSAKINSAAVPFLDDVMPLAKEGIYPGGAQRNLNRIDKVVEWGEDVSNELKIMLSDPQTSGGLLAAVSPEHADELVTRLQAADTPAAAMIGEVIEGPESKIHLE